MNDDPPDRFKECRQILVVVGLLLGVPAFFFGGVPFLHNWLSASHSAAGQPFLQASTWDEDDVDPSQAPFSTLVLSGTYKATAGQYTRVQSGRFEIVMRGEDLYFRREWRQWVGGWRWTAEIGVTNFHGLHNHMWKGHGSGGGGSLEFGAKARLLIARRLWVGTNFVGAHANSLWDQTEFISKVEKIGPYLIPRAIIFQGSDARQFTYTVKTVRFRNDPSESWFTAKRPRFGYSERDEREYIAARQSLEANAPPIQQ